MGLFWLVSLYQTRLAFYSRFCGPFWSLYRFNINISVLYLLIPTSRVLKLYCVLFCHTTNSLLCLCTYNINFSVTSVFSNSVKYLKLLLDYLYHTAESCKMHLLLCVDSIFISFFFLYFNEENSKNQFRLSNSHLISLLTF